MKAKELQKQSEVIENIYRDISDANNRGQFKHFIPHWIYLPDSVKLKLIEDGYKIYQGAWDGINNDGLIIEW